MKTVMKLALLGCVALGLVAAAATDAQAQDKPNILIIWGDDIGQFNVSAYNMGMMGYRTPNIDPHRPGKARCSPTGTASRAARPAAPPSSLASRRFAPA